MNTRVVWIGPSQVAGCGLCGAGALFLHGLSKLPDVELTWVTNVAPERGAVPVDPLVADVPRVPWWRQSRCATERDLSVGIDFRFDAGILDWSADVLAPWYAEVLLKDLRRLGAKTVVRIHSQALQNLDPKLVDLFVGPRPYLEMVAFDDGTPGGHLRDVPEARYACIPHPCGVPPNPAPAVEPVHVFGMGRRDRMPHGEIEGLCTSLGLVYEAWEPGFDPWTPVSEITARAAEASRIVLWYPNIPGVGSSSVLGLAVATGRPVICSPSNWLRDAHEWCTGWDGLEAALAAEPQVNGFQAVYAAKWTPERCARRLVEAALEVR